MGVWNAPDRGCRGALLKSLSVASFRRRGARWGRRCAARRRTSLSLTVPAAASARGSPPGTSPPCPLQTEDPLDQPGRQHQARAAVNAKILNRLCRRLGLSKNSVYLPTRLEMATPAAALRISQWCTDRERQPDDRVRGDGPQQRAHRRELLARGEVAEPSLQPCRRRPRRLLSPGHRQRDRTSGPAASVTWACARSPCVDTKGDRSTSAAALTGPTSMNAAPCPERAHTCPHVPSNAALNLPKRSSRNML